LSLRALYSHCRRSAAVKEPVAAGRQRGEGGLRRAHDEDAEEEQADDDGADDEAVGEGEAVLRAQRLAAEHARPQGPAAAGPPAAEAVPQQRDQQDEQAAQDREPHGAVAVGGERGGEPDGEERDRHGEAGADDLERHPDQREHHGAAV
jgi:hypothetical protein